MLRYSYLWMIAVFLLSSCLSNKQTVIMQNSGFKTTEAKVVLNEVPEYILQPNDVISIRIKSLNRDQSEYLNIQPDNMMNINAVATYLNGYSIDEEGFIYVPNIGEVKLEGLTLKEARALLQSKINEQLAQATVFLTLVSFKVSILGEVQKPGYYYVYNNQLNVMEAVALAGDFADYADLKRIHLIRQTESGSESILLDLTDSQVLVSPYYYLQPSDVLYVPPLEVKNNRHNLANLTVVNVLLTGITTTVAVISLINQTQRLREE